MLCARHPDMGLCMGVEQVAVGVRKWMMGTTELAGEVGDSNSDGVSDWGPRTRGGVGEGNDSGQCTSEDATTYLE